MAIKKSELVRGIAKERLSILYKLAREAYATDPELSRAYVKLIRQISRHYKIKLEKEIKDNLCRKCNSVLIPGLSLSIRVVGSKKYMIYKCTNCNAESRIYY